MIKDEIKLKKPKKLQPSKPPREVESAYKQELKKLAQKIRNDINELIIPLMQSSTGVPNDCLVNDNINFNNMLVVFSERMEIIRNNYDRLTDQYQRIAESFGRELGSLTRRRFHRMLRRSLGAQVDLVEIVSEKGVKEMLDFEIRNNARLIKSIPTQYLDKVEQLVRDNFFKGSSTPGGLQADILPLLRKEIREQGKSAIRRAELIARDQTGKVASALTKQRHLNIGITKYKWHNSQDRRVVGNPNGLYPKGNKNHGDHWKREGKTYSYSKPPHDGNPGEPPLCRCVAIPIIEKIKTS